MLRNGNSARRISVTSFPESFAVSSGDVLSATQFSEGSSPINHQLNLAHRPNSEVLGDHLSRLASRPQAFRLEVLRINHVQETQS
jgi:hypothetical protein